jgi:predicted ArsR family transcriptional regulator
MRFIAPLTQEEVIAVERLHRGGRSHRERQRAHAVLLNAKGLTMDQSAHGLGVDRDAVSRWLTRWEQGGIGALADAPKSGRPRKVAASEQAEVVAAACASPASPQRELAKKGGCPPVGTL